MTIMFNFVKRSMINRNVHVYASPRHTTKITRSFARSNAFTHLVADPLRMVLDAIRSSVINEHNGYMASTSNHAEHIEEHRA
jgi:hypothetical protein